MSGLFASYGATFLIETGARSSGLGVFVTETVRSGAPVDLAGNLTPTVAFNGAASISVGIAGGFAPAVAFGGDLTVTTPVRNYVDFSGNIGGASLYGKGSYGSGLYSRFDAIQPLFAGDLDIVGQDYFDGDLAPAVTFAGTLQVVHGLGAGDISPIVTFSGNLQLQAGLAGDIAPQVDFSASLTFDTLLAGGFGFTVIFAAAGLISGPLWEETEPCSTPDWEPTEPCPPPAWSATAPCPPPMWTSTTPSPPSMWTPTDPDSVEWEKSELCNG